MQVVPDAILSRTVKIAPDDNSAFEILKILGSDLERIQDELLCSDTQSRRRELVRASAAAMESLVWLLRERTLKFLADEGRLEPVVAMALCEQIYTVAENGRIDLKSKAVPLSTSFRMVTKLLSDILPDAKVDLNAHGWGDLKRTLKIRNRITHPSSGQGLEVADSEVEVVNAALFWLFDEVTRLLKLMLEELRVEAAITKYVVEGLLRGDHEIVDIYEKAIESE